MATKRSRRAPSVGAFYESALDEAQRLDLRSARDLAGLDEEIALLRLRLRESLRQGQDTSLLLRSIDLLVKAVVARYRLGTGEEAALADKVRELLAYQGEIESEAAGAR